jgi:acyl-CoA hydrolase
MRGLKVLGVCLCVLALCAMALAGANNLVLRDANRVTFVAPIRIGTSVLPAGEYLVRHTMEGQEHIMVFQPTKGKGVEVRAKCTLVPLTQKADRSTTSYQVNAANERVLQELVFQGETAKHVF